MRFIEEVLVISYGYMPGHRCGRGQTDTKDALSRSALPICRL